jgi:lysyl-tRNA synthetase class 2
MANDEVKKVFLLRSAVIREIRNFLHERGFTEVETPMMQPMAGGASATPFETHYNALSARMFFRIAPELYLKRLLVGGFDKIFELNRNFRNEGLSRYHNPEFTMLELYQAFGDMGTMKELIQGMICHLADTVIGSRKVGAKDAPADLDQWTTVNYVDLVKGKAGDDFYSLDLAGKRERARSLGCVIPEQFDEIEIAQEIFEKLIEKTLLNPTFVVRLPAALVPLAKPCADDPNYVDVYELIIGGREISPGYSELNDPLIQRSRFEAQAAGDASKVDHDFLDALEHGMPPAGGMGVGIDRLVMLLTGAESIRDVILFPQLKPKG